MIRLNRTTDGVSRFRQALFTRHHRSISAQACAQLFALPTGKQIHRVAKMKRIGASSILAIIAFFSSSMANAMTDCSATLNEIFTGDISGTGAYGLYLIFTYTL